MKEAKQGHRCKKCGTLYPYGGIPRTCNGCGEAIGDAEIDIPHIPGMSVTFSLPLSREAIESITRIVPNENCENVMVRRKFFHWEVLESE